MREEKKFISAEYVTRLNASPFFLVVDYKGLSVAQFSELRKRLNKAGGEVHVVKNTLFKIAVKEAGLGDLGSSLSGQIASVTGKKDIAAVAKVIKTFQSEFERPKLQFGYLGNKALSADEVRAIAELPPLNELQAKILGLLQAPAQKLAAVIGTPGSQVARIVKAYSEKAA
jgi:large subunit ribosomal protein L10